MGYGNLHVFVGPMFAGKTEELVKEVLYQTYFIPPDEVSERVGIFKPAIDTRFSSGQIVSHKGASIEARPICGVDEVESNPWEVCFFDEVQFFSAGVFDGDFASLVRRLRMQGTTVFCAGLDMDYLGRAFEVTSTLMAEATEVRRLVAQCDICAAAATHTARHDLTAERIMVGATDLYAPMCADHWFEARQKHLARRSPEEAAAGDDA